MLLFLGLCLCVIAICFLFWVVRESVRLMFFKTEARSILAQSVRTQYGVHLPDPFTKSESFYEKILLEAGPFLHADARALDVGCGPGRLVFEYEKVGVKKSCGLDSSKQYIRYCNNLKNGKIETSYYIPKQSTSEFECGDILKGDVPPKSFDFISCINVFDRVKDPTKLFEELHATLDANGTLLITTPYDWAFSSAPKTLHTDNMKNVFSETSWSIEKEIKNIPYTIPITKNTERTYACHMLILRNKAVEN